MTAFGTLYHSSLLNLGKGETVEQCKAGKHRHSCDDHWNTRQDLRRTSPRISK